MIRLIVLIGLLLSSGCAGYAKGYLAGQKHVIDSLCEGWAHLPDKCKENQP